LTSSPFFNPYAPIEESEHRLPHWQQDGVFCFVTWRLADSLPKEKLIVWQAEREAWRLRHPEPWDEKTDEDYHERFSHRLEQWLDQGHGACLLRDPQRASIVAEALLHFDAERYNIVNFAVMPNHVHVLVRLHVAYPLGDVVKSWKGFTAREINRRIGRTGPLWQEDYWDRLIRNERHLYKCAEYIRNNPAEAHLNPSEFITGGSVSNPTSG
jgi:REP element-mobilizing transposase RayT